MQNYYNPLRIIFDPIAFRYHQKLFDQKKSLPISRFTFISKFLHSNSNNTTTNKKILLESFRSCKVSNRVIFKCKKRGKKERRKKGKRLLNGNFIVNGNDKS